MSKLIQFGINAHFLAYQIKCTVLTLRKEIDKEWDILEEYMKTIKRVIWERICGEKALRKTPNNMEGRSR